MRVPSCAWDAAVVIIVVSFVTGCLAPLAAAQAADAAAAERILGPQWKQLSRRAGMIFAGTVLAAAGPIATEFATGGRPQSGAISALRVCFRVDEAIVGVKPGQILTIHEWAGVASWQRPMHAGQRHLLFLYPVSRLGLTSPVGGGRGQVRLDGSGRYALNPMRGVSARVVPSESPPGGGPGAGIVSVVQLERAIRSAREE